MSAKARKKRDRQRYTADRLRRKANPITCPNCGQLTEDGHFAPPSMGEAGFFACLKSEDAS